jgi:hypothetical protein
VCPGLARFVCRFARNISSDRKQERLSTRTSPRSLGIRLLAEFSDDLSSSAVKPGLEFESVLCWCCVPTSSSVEPGLEFESVICWCFVPTPSSVESSGLEPGSVLYWCLVPASSSGRTVRQPDMQIAFLDRDLIWVRRYCRRF